MFFFLEKQTMNSLFLSKEKNIIKPLGREYNPDCIFCKKIKNNQRLLYEDEEIAIFHDIKDASAREHILICSTAHIPDVNSLLPYDIELIKKMEEFVNFFLVIKFSNKQKVGIF